MSLTHTIALVSFLVLGCSARSVQLDDKIYEITGNFSLETFTWTKSDRPLSDDFMIACGPEALDTTGVDKWQLVYSKDDGDSGTTEVNVEGEPITDSSYCGNFTMTNHKAIVADGTAHIFEVFAIVTDDTSAQFGTANISMNLDGLEASLVTTTFNTDQYLYRLATSGDTTACFPSNVDGVCYSDDDSVISSFSSCVAEPDQLHEGATVDVCSGEVTLGETALDVGTVTLNELQYPAADGEDAALLFLYTDGDVATALELVMVDADDAPYVYNCPNLTACTLTNFTAGDGLYSATVVGLNAASPDGTAVSAAAGTIQDILLEGVYKAPFFEFAFKNSNPDASPKYHAALASDSSVQATIDCSGINPDSICFGFLEVTDPAEGDRVRVDFLPDNTNVIQSALITTTEVPPQ